MYLNYSFILLFVSLMSVIFCLKLMSMGPIGLEFKLLMSNSINLDYILYFDWISISFMALVLIISSMVVLYSKYYMGVTLTTSKFMVLLLLFVSSMCLMVLSPNMFSILLGWDGLGLISYLLVIYYQNMKSALSGVITILSNRVGDAALIIALIMLMKEGSLSFSYLNLNGEYMLFLGILFLAGITKSAQLPFMAWLPAAMAAPTPISALVHSSTLVTAGVYLFIRYSPLISFFFCKLIIVVSLLTLIISSFAAFIESDFKKIIALSTLSQLSVMIMVLSLGNFMFSYFHLLSHALFKSLLFLTAGVVIHASLGNQDLRLMGSFFFSLPFTSFIMNVSNFSLMGFPFMCGFYSKDLIIESFFFNEINLFLMTVMMTCMILTSMYSLRMMKFSLVMSPKGLNISGENTLLLIPMIILFIMVIMGGGSLMWGVFEGGSSFTMCLNMEEKLAVFMIFFWGLLLFNMLSMGGFKLNWAYNFFLSFFSLMGNLVILSNSAVSKKFLYSGKVSMNILGSAWMEFYGPLYLWGLIFKMYYYVEKWGILMFKNYFFIFLLVFLVAAIYLVILIKSMMLKLSS